MTNEIRRDIGSYCIAFILFILVIYKAATLSMTHDESASFFYLNDKNIVPYLFNSNVWPNANNHWLNTLSFQLTSRVFGPQEWAIRLPNVLCFLLYAVYSIRLLSGIKINPIRFFGLLLMLANPYVLDFFSTARGYGMSLGMTTASLYYTTQFIKTEQIKELAKALILLLLATLSLFSSLIYFPAMMGPLGLYLLIKYKGNLLIEKVYRPLAVISLLTVITIGLTYIPLKALSGNEEFKWGAKTLMECFKSLVYNSAYSKPYSFNEYFLVGILFTFMLYCLSRLIKNIKSIESIQENRTQLLALSTFIFLLLGMVMARYTVGTYYPIERKTIMFIPFVGLISAYALSVNTTKVKNIGAWLLSLVLIIHFILAFDHDQVREWWYDRDTKDFIKQIAEDANGTPVTIGCHWLYHPTLLFYSKTKYGMATSIMDYNKNIDTDTKYNYYVCFDSDYEQLKETYELLHKNQTGRMILKLK